MAAMGRAEYEAKCTTEWNLPYDVPGILREIYEMNRDRWGAECSKTANASLSPHRWPPRLDLACALNGGLERRYCFKFCTTNRAPASLKWTLSLRAEVSLGI